MTKFLTLLFILFEMYSTNSYATTWDEPWAEKVIKESTSFILAKVVSNDPDKGITVVVLKTLSGEKLKDTILISNFYSLTLCSSSNGEGGQFHTTVVDSCFFFLKQNNKKQFCIATPTAGFDYVSDGEVVSTFRHSYHQASVPISIYEKAMTAVFNNYHKLPYDKSFIEKFINENLSKPPAGFSEEKIKLFFLQHVALECIYHLKLNIKESLLTPFLNDKKNFHNQVSAARALHNFNTEISKKELLKIIGDTTKRDFVRVICVWSLGDLNCKELKSKLQKIEKSVSDESDGFGGNIMDPRICTRFPSLKSALENLISKL
jgi:hypothetical protein